MESIVSKKSENRNLGNLKVTMEGETFDGNTLDTNVTIEGCNLCWITWADREKFLSELNAVIQKYRI